MNIYKWTHGRICGRRAEFEFSDIPSQNGIKMNEKKKKKSHTNRMKTK